MKSLDFMIVGAQKSGTTALSEFLSEHPEIEMASNKEAHIFDAEAYNNHSSVAEINQLYEPLFSKGEDVLRGEATPIYLYMPEIAVRLFRYNPDLRIIVILRDPVERAYSQYRMELSRGNENLPFWQALLAEPYRLFKDRHCLADDSSRRRHSYRNRGYYGRQLRNLIKRFSSEQILVLRTEDLRERHEHTLKQVFEFLSVEPQIIAQREVFSHSGSLDEVPISSYFLRKCFRRELSELATLVDISTENWQD